MVVDFHLHIPQQFISMGNVMNMATGKWNVDMIHG